MDPAVERVVSVMRARYQERLYVPDLAAEEYFSPFHFTRIFRRETGVSPGQYLAAVRLFEAKRLLLSTSLSVADIACRVGYPGIGTFTTRFTRSVGISPRQYRRLPPEAMLYVADGARRLPSADVLPRRPHLPGGVGRTDGHRAPAIHATVHFGAKRVAGRVLVAVFDDPVPQGPPVAWSVGRCDGVDPWRFDGLPEGRWVVIAVAEQHAAGSPAAAPVLFGVGAAVEVRAGHVARVDIELHQSRRTDPPIMVPLCNQLPAAAPLVA